MGARGWIAVLVLAVGFVACLFAAWLLGSRDIPGAATYAGVWVQDPDADTTRAELREKFARAAAEGMHFFDIGQLRDGAEVPRGPRPPQQGLLVLILLPNGEAGARPEPPGVLGTAVGRWEHEGDHAVVTLTESMGQELSPPVILRCARKGDRLEVQAWLPDDERKDWTFVRFAPNADCYCTEGADRAPTWCWEHQRGFLARGETDCWRCVFSARRGEPCPICPEREVRNARAALRRGDRAAAKTALHAALRQAEDAPHLRFLLGEVRGRAAPTTWSLAEGLIQPRVVGGRVVARNVETSTLHVHDGVTGRPLLALEMLGDDPFWTISPDGAYLAMVQQGKVTLHALGTEAEPVVLADGDPPFQVASFASGAPVLVAASSSGRVRAWALDGTLRWERSVPAIEPWSLTTDARGERAAVILMKGQTFVVDTGVSEDPRALDIEQPQRMLFDPADRRRLIAMRFMSEPILLDLDHPNRNLPLPSHGMGVAFDNGGWFAWNGRRFLFFDHQNMQICDPTRTTERTRASTDDTPGGIVREEAVAQLAYLAKHRRPVGDDPVSPDRMRFATVGEEGDVYIWAADTLALLVRHPTRPGEVHSLGFAPDADHLIVSREDGGVVVLEVAPDRRPKAEILAEGDER